MEVEKEALQLVQGTLSSINVVMEDWKTLDNNSKNRFSARVERLKKWKEVLEKWKEDFVKADSDNKYYLLLQLHDISGQMT